MSSIMRSCTLLSASVFRTRIHRGTEPAGCSPAAEAIGPLSPWSLAASEPTGGTKGRPIARWRIPGTAVGWPAVSQEGSLEIGDRWSSQVPWPCPWLGPPCPWTPGWVGDPRPAPCPPGVPCPWEGDSGEGDGDAPGGFWEKYPRREASN